ncbi:uncharacterized protein VTP21DRAFT_337 [Calcarisporiella thermophila]|uniref:uncharacterized protein n=1 Tax=Calcarisporiella thermophila TaxID=911321 RepID=UPI0037440190
MKITPVPCLDDNYAYLVVDEKTGQAAVVDPVEPKKIVPVIEKAKCTVVGVITTHHHWDHSGGNEEFLALYPGIKVWGGDDRIPGLTNACKHDETFNIGEIKVKSLHTPCHTKGSVSFFLEDGEQRAVFTGDTLFLGGCGRFFEGTAEQMQRSLNEVLASLPDDTKVYCGHEYTKSNLKFALSVEPDNQAIQEAVKKAENASCTVPGTLAHEKATNPFMRVKEQKVQAATGETDAVAVMAKLREMKNNFK